MSSPLVDPEGFPRADIDVYTVRHARAAIVRLRNDHRAVVEEMGRVLQVVYAARDGQELGSATGESMEADRSGQRGAADGQDRQSALAKVNAVAPGSPASQAVRLFDNLMPIPCSLFARREWKRMTLSSNSGNWTGTTRWRTLERSLRLPKAYVDPPYLLPSCD
jgi:hypothetical protein